MKTLEEFNKERGDHYRMMNSNEPRLNGIACPECGAELYDSRPNSVLASYPPKKNVHCSQCKYVGYRIY